MKSLVRIAIFTVMIVGLRAFAQATPAQQTTQITVKSSPAEDTLVTLSKKSADSAKIYNDLLQQARSMLDQKNKPVLDQIKEKSAKWQAKIDAETKDLKAQIDANGREAEKDFQSKVQALQKDIASQQTIEALVSIVKKQENLPDNATFDPQKQVWTVPVAPEIKK